MGSKTRFIKVSVDDYINALAFKAGPELLELIRESLKAHSTITIYINHGATITREEEV